MRVGIDLGGTNIAAGLVDENYHIIHKGSVPTGATRPYQEVIRDMGLLVNRLCEEAGVDIHDLEQVGIGCPGTPVKEQGIVLYANNLYWHNVPLFEELSKYVPCPLRMDNDANAAALGETLAGAAKGAKEAVMVTLGTGVGGGIIIDGKVYDGVYHGGAEVGHTVIVSGGEMCSCGRRGCWEAYASVTALIRMANKAADENPESRLAVHRMLDGQLNGRNIFLAADEENDPAAKAVIDQYLFYVAEGLINMMDIFQPEIVVIGGGVCAQGERILAPLREYIKRDIYCKLLPIPPLVTAALGNDAGIIGAAYV